jgi:polar amino acid transport system substrate-binding protein
MVAQPRGLLAIVALGALLLAAAPAGADSLVVSHMVDDPVSAKVFPILREAYRKIGQDLSAAKMPRERAIVAADRGETDGDVMRIAGIDKLYPNLVQVPEPVTRFHIVAFTTGFSFKVDGWESLRPYSLCILRGMKAAEQPTEGMQRMFANSNDQAILMLRSGRCEVAVLGHEVWPDIDRLQAGPLRAVEPPIVSIPLFHYVNRRHAELVPKLTEALQRMRADGTIAALLSVDERAIGDARQRNSLPER